MIGNPFVGITMGDPAGVGPEIIGKVLADKGLYECCRPVVLGDSEVLSDAIRRSSGKLTLNPISDPSQARSRQGQVDVLELPGFGCGEVVPGTPNRSGFVAMMNYITEAVEMTSRGDFKALVTCPISKMGMQRAGFPDEGHTQFIARLTRTEDYVMMLAGKSLRVALVTIHSPLKSVPGMLSIERIYRTIIITHHSMRQDFAIDRPRLAVAALNPHAGEEGLFGFEEERMIEPAVEKAKAEGIPAEGPIPADSLFYRAVSGEFHAVVAMYHDQGLIPLKLLHFCDAVNVTLGLPIVRTSVDHGTAYDIAGSGQADASSLKAAIRLATLIIKNRSMEAA